MTQTMPDANPYAASYDAYYHAGWRPIPLPYRAKTPPPTGYTGRGGLLPSYADMCEWVDHYGPANVALWMRPGLMGLDVDAYDGKPGEATLRDLVAECGPLPPTYLSSSRGDGISGIRVYRVPLDVEFITGLPGVDIIQPSHRYVVAWPSVHPNGGTYVWVDERTGQRMTTPPRLADIPELPAAWVERLRRAGEVLAKADTTPAQYADFIAGLPTGEPCACVQAAATIVPDNRSRHDLYLAAVLATLGAGRRGCPGAKDAVVALARAYPAAIADRCGEAEARAEFARMVDGAVAMLRAEPQGECCPDAWAASLPLADEVVEADAFIEALPDEVRAVVEPEPDVEVFADVDGLPVLGSALAHETRRHLIDLQAREQAREAYALLKAGKRGRPEIVPAPAFMAAPDEEVAYRVEGLWPMGGRVLLVAQAKTGKTTLVVSNLLPALLGHATAGAFLGREVAPASGSIVYINVEVGEVTLRRWLRRAHVPIVDRLHILNLRGQASALELSTRAGRDYWSAVLRDLDAEIVILDPVAPVLAAHGLDENSNTDVAMFWSWWGEMLKAGGVTDDLVVHHAGHAGERSRGASRLLDEPDAIWTLTKAGGDEGDRYIEAIGRDVELARHVLGFTPETGALTMGEAKGKADSDKSVETWRKRMLEIIDREGFIYRSVAAKLGGGNRTAERQAWIDDAVEDGLLEESEGPKRNTTILVRAGVPHAYQTYQQGAASRRTSVPPSIDGYASTRARDVSNGWDA